MGMQRRIVILLITCVFVLSGCFRSAAASVVEDMYRQALLEETDQVMTFFSEAFLEEYEKEEVMEEIISQVREEGGLKSLNVTEIRTNQLNAEIIDEVNRQYTDDWSIIANDVNSSHVMVWIVIKTSTQYEIVDAKKMTIEAYQENIMN